MMNDRYSPEDPKVSRKAPEARYAYYRRCQVFRRGGEQCKAPAEKGSHICYAHAGQLAMAVRREQERRAVLAEAVAQMRKRGRPECQMADLFMDFKGINVTLAVMMQAVIDGRVDCKTAGRLVVQLQTVSKLLRILHRKGRKGNRISPQICADERRLGKEKASTTRNTKKHEGRKTLPRINADDADMKEPAQEPSLTAEARRHSPHQAKTGLVRDPGGEEPRNLPLIHTDSTDLKEPAEDPSHSADVRGRREKTGATNWAANEGERTRIALVTEVLAIVNGRGWAHAPPELLRAA